MLNLILVLGLPALLILVPVYAFGSTQKSAQIFIRLSIVQVENPRKLWFTLAFNYFTAGVVFYGLYLFYRNLSVYRQAFLRSPSSCVAQVTMRRYANNLGSIENVHGMLDLTSRSVVLTNVSSKYSKSDIQAMFEQMGLPDICAVVIVQNRKRVRTLLERRNSMLEQLEVDLATLYSRILRHLAALRGTKRAALERELRGERRINAQRRVDLLRLLLADNVLQQFRPVHKKDKETTVDAITFHYKSLIRRDSDLIRASQRFAHDNERYALDAEHRVADGENAADPSETDILVAEKTLVSWKQFKQFKGNVKDYGLTLWGTSMSIIIVFGSQRSALIGKQCLLSGRPFAMEAYSAPTADDIIWENLYLPAADRFVRSLFGDLLYLMVNILFATVNLAIVQILTVKNLEDKLSFVHDLLTEFPSLRGVLTGIIAPLFYNIFLLIAPYMLYGLSVYQGKISKTAVQESLLQKYTWLLFAQSFIVFIFSSTLLVILEKVINGNYGQIISQIQAHVPEDAAFYMNIVIQRALISLMLVLLRIVPLVIHLLGRTFWRNNVRRHTLNAAPAKVSMGCIYPEQIAFVFMITMAFLPLTPVISLAALVFYSISYLVFRYHFIYSYEIPHESGGKYWTFLPTPILVGCMMGQIFTMIQFAFRDGTAQALLLAPLLIITLGSIIFMKRVFERRSDNLPLGPEGTARSNNLARIMRERQTEIVLEVAQRAGEDTVVLEEGEEMEREKSARLNVGDCKYETVPYDFGEASPQPPLDLPEGFQDISATDNPYCNPIVFKRHAHLMLPAAFFHVLQMALGGEEQFGDDAKTAST